MEKTGKAKEVLKNQEGDIVRGDEEVPSARFSPGKVDKRFIVNLQGKDFILHAGLLNAFHENGGQSISTELVRTPQAEGGMWIFKATAIGDRGTYNSYGDASSQNVNSAIAKHVMRMAETRAINRALRLYNNIGICSVDELGEADVNAPKPSILTPSVPRTTQYAPLPPRASQTEAAAAEIFDLPPCDICGNPLREKTGKFGKFFGCSAYPKCRKIVNPDQLAGYIKTWESQRPQNQAPLPNVAPPPYQEETATDLPWENEDTI